MFQPRSYRKRVQHDDLVGFAVCVDETDLHICAAGEYKEQAVKAVREARTPIIAHGKSHPEFFTSLTPLPVPNGVREPVRTMYEAANVAGVGPMAAVAGAVAQYVGEKLHHLSPDVIVENGGDVYLISTRSRVVAIHAGASPLSKKIGIALPEGQACGVCTSSGTVGHSLSLGKADAAVVISPSAALADAVATALANRVKGPEDVASALEWVQGIAGIVHAAVIINDTLGAWGQFDLVPLSDNS